MTDRIDPGPGWRLLKIGERKPKGYEWRSPYRETWNAGLNIGETFKRNMDPCRVRIAPTATKAIATRATVRGVFPDGAITSHSIECKTGLNPEMMAAASERWALANKYLPESGAKYIMLEIQREGEP